MQLHQLVILACISLLFFGCCKGLNEKELDSICSDIECVSDAIDIILTEHESMSDVESNLGIIQNINGVKRAYISGNVLFVELKSWDKIAFIYSHEYDYGNSNGSAVNFMSKYVSTNLTKGVDSQPKAVIAIQNILDQSFHHRNEYLHSIRDCLERNGIACDIELDPDLKWFENNMFYYDVVLLSTHCFYDPESKLHWLLTSLEDDRNILRTIVNSYNSGKDNDKLLLRIVSSEENRKGQLNTKHYYIAISENHIDAIHNSFSGAHQHIVFNGGCQSLKGSNSMAESFIKKGADCYLGYDETNANSPYAMGDFVCKGLLSGLSVREAYNQINDFLKHEVDHDQGLISNLLCIPDEIGLNDIYLTFKHNAVDLGLSVKWANANLGAHSPYGFGDYYAWGETVANKNDYSWKTYKYCNGSESSLTKYNNEEYFGVVDNITELKPEDDAAITILGDGWRLPTKSEWTELWETRQDSNYKWELLSFGTSMGWKITYRVNNNSIILPDAGYMHEYYLNTCYSANAGRYWSSSLMDKVFTHYAYCFDSVLGVMFDDRYFGFSIRPVCE